jgi:hypothetical protein
VLLAGLGLHIEATQSSMVGAGIVKECADCAVTGEGTCCGVRTGYKCDSVLLLINLLLGRIFPHAPADTHLWHFLTNQGCATCHAGINMGGEAYFPFGLVERPSSEIVAGDTGRYKITKSKSDEYVFKAPSLRNIDLTAPYFHSGKVWNLKEAVKIMGVAQLGAVLTAEEIDKIEDFLKTTTGVQPRVEYPILPAPTEQTPRPKVD